jgi:hypothetical protein
MAQHAVRLKPHGARERQALSAGYFARREVAAAFAAGERAQIFNRLDPYVSLDYGIQLVRDGQIEKGASLLKDSAAGLDVLPASAKFYLFLVAYLGGDQAAASRYANLETCCDHPLRIVARALAASATEGREQSRLVTRRLVAAYPQFRDRPRDAIARFISSTSLVDRLMHDLDVAGLNEAR